MSSPDGRASGLTPTLNSQPSTVFEALPSTRQDFAALDPLFLFQLPLYKRMI